MSDTQYVLSLSYGKDSLACLGAIEELGWPLDALFMQKCGQLTRSLLTYHRWSNLSRKRMPSSKSGGASKLSIFRPEFLSRMVFILKEAEQEEKPSSTGKCTGGQCDKGNGACNS